MSPEFYGIETVHASFPNGTQPPTISYGLPFPEACSSHVQWTYKATRVYLIVSRFLATNTNAVERLSLALGSKVVGKRVGMRPHTFWSEVVSIINDARRVSPELIITLGAGSLTDAAKIIAWALANDIHTIEDLGTMAATANRNDLKPAQINVISIPTSLSGGEYQPYAGATNDETKVKTLFSPPPRNPALVILDPAVTLSMPESIWLSTGIRSVDHCVESMCSLQSTPESDHAARQALEIIIPALLRCKSDPTSLAARHQAQLGALKAMHAVSYGVPMGASHAIGHQLGPLGVGHGETSCIILPAVCKFNAADSTNVEKQELVMRCLLEMPEVRQMVEKEQKPDLGDVLDIIISYLGMPRTLKDVGQGRDKLEILAQNTLTDKWATTNPVPLTTRSQVMEILEMVVD